MSKVLSKADTVTCSFQGKVQFKGAARLEVNSQPVLVVGSIVGAEVTACAGAGSNQPVCTSVQSVSAGKAEKLEVDGEAVLLDSLGGLTAPAHVPNKLLIPVPPAQTKLEAS
ncbi:hypothetical protein [Microvirga pakistanensis]|uniref:hypothetical protein n=1 Tax=Microvirga pakistanensis TaxID=1682650 RepID=UPI0010697064|nr:hypothetical protein [Microvirga pakistanensis]